MKSRQFHVKDIAHEIVYLVIKLDVSMGYRSLDHVELSEAVC